MQTDFDRLVKRVESLYGEQRQQPNIPPVYLVTPPTSKATELDEAVALCWRSCASCRGWR